MSLEEQVQALQDLVIRLKQEVAQMPEGNHSRLAARKRSAAAGE